MGGSRLRKLNLSYNEVGEGVQAIGFGLLNNEALTDLDLSRNRAGPKAGLVIGHLLCVNRESNPCGTTS